MNKQTASFGYRVECKRLHPLWFLDGKEAELSIFTPGEQSSGHYQHLGT